MEQDDATQAEISAVREAYTDKINAAIGRGEDKLAIELSAQFREEAFARLLDRRGGRTAA
jgi:hypothetical protein